MSDTTYTDLQTPAVNAAWLNDVNITVYRALGVLGVAPTTPDQVVANIAALARANNLSDVASAVTSLANLGGCAKSANLSDVANAVTALANLNGMPILKAGNDPWGLTLSNDITLPLTVLAIAAGFAMDSTHTYRMGLSTAWTKNMDATFVAGAGNGGLWLGTLAVSTWYHVFLIRKASDASIDVYADTSVLGANIPAGYTALRVLGSFKTDGAAHILPFLQVGSTFLWGTPIIDLSANPVDALGHLVTLNTPPGVGLFALLVGTLDESTATSNALLLTSPDCADVSAATVWQVGLVATAANLSSTATGQLLVATDNLARIRWRVANFTGAGATGVTIACFGWIDTRIS